MKHLPSILCRALSLGAAALCAIAIGCDEDKPEPALQADKASAALATDKPEDDQGDKPATASATSATADSLPKGLLVAYAQFEVEQGKVTAKPGPARLELIYRDGGEWHTRAIEDDKSNVFHKAMTYTAPDGKAAILTFSGMEAAVKMWQPKGSGFDATTLWTEKFGGKFDRMRDAEVADVYGDGKPAIVVGTHDQGVVAALRPEGESGYEVVRLGEKKDTFVHEIEIGDLDGDEVLEVYATPSEPNKLDGSVQHGEVWRFVPKDKKGPDVVADLGNRHAKEIYVGDVDGDGRDELYVAVEALTERSGSSVRLVEPVEIRRYDADTAPDKGVSVATLPDRLCRFLTVGDVDGDGDKEMVAAAFRSGLWLLSPPASGDKGGQWQVKNIDRESSGFEHAALLADLDENGKDELYVASDEQGELRRYLLDQAKPQRETIHKRDLPGQMMTWNLMVAPKALLSGK